MVARGSTAVVKVRFEGDPKDLQDAAKKADKSLSGFAASTKGLLAGAAFAGAATAVVGFANTALQEGDRVGDALARLEGQIGDDLTAALDDASDKFADLGQSRGDILDLQAAFADFATSVGLTDDAIAKIAGPVAEAAAKLALISENDAATNIDLINKAAQGSPKALKELGIKLDDAAIAAQALEDSGKDTPDQLTDSELAAAGYAAVLEQLAPKLETVAAKNGDMEQTLASVDAKLETLTGRIGEAIDGPLNDFLTWTLNGTDGLGELYGLMEKSPKFLDVLGDAFEKVTAGPLDSMLDTVHDILDAIGLVNKTPLTVKYTSTPNPDRRDRDFEASVIGAIRDYASRNGLRIL